MWVMNMKEKQENIEVVIENSGENLEISPVYEHLNVARPNPKEDRKKIIIPEVKEKNNSNM